MAAPLQQHRGSGLRTEPVQAEHEETFSCDFLCNNWIFMDKSAFHFIDILGLLVRQMSKAGYIVLAVNFLIKCEKIVQSWLHDFEMVVSFLNTHSLTCGHH